MRHDTVKSFRFITLNTHTHTHTHTPTHQHTNTPITHKYYSTYPEDFK